MELNILSLTVDNEMDIILAYKRASQLGELAGLSYSERNRFATAVSEICRSSIEYSSGGEINYVIHKKESKNYILCNISSKGPAIDNLTEIIQNNSGTILQSREMGMVNAMRLVEVFSIDSDQKEGIKISLGFSIKDKKEINETLIKDWQDKVNTGTVHSPYEEMKVKNHQLVKLSDELQKKNEELTSHFREIELLNNRLKLKNQKLKDFTFIISHDLRTPLTSLKLWLELAMKEENSENYKSFIENARNAADKFELTINDLVSLIENRKSDEKNSIGEAFQSLAHEFDYYFKDNGATIETCFNDEPVKIEKPLLESILKNLINNSIKYKKDDRELRINLESYIDGNYVVLMVRDNGIGIDLKRDGHKLFQPFKRITEKKDGKGLGLHIVKEIIDKTGGKIEVESTPEIGTAFYCYFPRFQKATAVSLDQFEAD